MSRPTSGKTRPRPVSGGKMKARTANGEVVSYEDVLVAQYLDELKKSPPYTKSGSRTEPSPYTQKLSSTHIVPTSSRTGRVRPQSASTDGGMRSGKARVDPKFIADSSMWDATSPRETVPRSRRKRPVSAPVYKRPLSATYGHSSRPSSAKSGTSSSGGRRSKPLFRRQPHTIVVTAFRNGSRDTYAKVAAPTIKILLEICTEKLDLAHAGRRVFLDDGTEIFTPREIGRDAEVYISMGEPYKDPYKGVKKQSKIVSGATWTMNGLVFQSDNKHSHSKTKLSKRFRSLIEQSRRRVLVFKNGKGTEGIEIVADPERFEDFLVACTAKLDLGSYARVIYDWDGNELQRLEDAPVLDQCLQTWSTPVLGPIWVSRGSGFSPKGVQVFLTGLINYTKGKVKEAKHYQDQLNLAKDESKRDQVEIVNIMSMSEQEIENTLDIVAKDIEDFSNALNRLKEQLRKVEEQARNEEIEGNTYTMKHIEEFDMNHRMVGQRGIKLKVYENGTYEESTVIYFNLTQASKGLVNETDKIMARLLDQCSGNHALANPRNNTALKAVAQKLYNKYGKEITNPHQLEEEYAENNEDLEVWLSFGEPFKNPFTFTIGAQFDKVQTYDVVGNKRYAVKEQLMGEDLDFTGSDRAGSWECMVGLPEDHEFTEIQEPEEPMEKEHLYKTMTQGEVDLNSSFLRAKKLPSLILYPNLMVDTKKAKGSKDLWPADAQIWVISKGGYIYNKAIPQVVLGVSEFGVSGNLGHPTLGKSNTKVEGFTVTLQKKESSNPNQQWRFTNDGFMYAQAQPELFLTYLGTRQGDEDTDIENEAENKPPGGQKPFIAVCEKLEGREARAQRWAIKQERMDNIGQWKHTKAENIEWNKKALSWPAKDDGEINEEFDWPMEGFLIPYAPPLKKQDTKNSLVGMTPIRLTVLKNGVRDISQAAAVVGPDLTNMRKDLHNKQKARNKKSGRNVPTETESADMETNMELLKLELTLFFERCTSLLGLPFAARRLFDESGKEFFSLEGLTRDQLVYVSCGEAWTDPKLTKAEQQRRYLLSNLSSDIAQIKQYVALREPQGLVLEVEGALTSGSHLMVNETAGKAERESSDDVAPEDDAPGQEESDREKMERMMASEQLSSHEIAHLRAEERLNSKRRPWEQGSGDFNEVTEVNGEEAEYTNREMFHRFRPQLRRGDVNISATLQKFQYDEGYITCQSNTNLVLGVHESEGRGSEVILVKKKADDILQRWVIHDNGLIQSKHNPQMVLSVTMPNTVTPDEEGSSMSYIGCLVTLQPRRTAQFGRANQRWHYDENSGNIQAFATDQMDKEITAANRANVCTYSVMGGNEIDQPGYIAEMQEHKGTKPKKLLVCSSCARAMRGRYKLEKLRDSLDYSCAMGTAKELGIRQIGSFKCLNGKVDLSTFEAEHTLEEWEGQLGRLRDEMSVRAIAKEISAARVPYTVKVLAYRNGEGRLKPGELIVGSSVLGILDQATYRLQMNTAARRLYTVDGTIILDLDDLVEWVKSEYIRQAQDQIKDEAKAKRKAKRDAQKEENEAEAEDKDLISKVELDEEEEQEAESEEHTEEDEYMLGYEATDREMIDSWSKYMALPNPDEAVGIDGYITQWNFYAKKTGIIILQVLRPGDHPNTYAVMEQVKIEVTEPGETLIDLREQPQWQDRGMEVQEGDVISLYWPGNAVIPYDIDPDIQGSLLYHMPEDEPQKGQQVHMEKWMEHGSRKYSLHATIVPRFGNVGKAMKGPEDGNTKKTGGRKAPHVDPPPLEMILRYPIEVWVSTGDAFQKPQKVEQNFASELQRREERAAVAYELDKEKHILRHMQGRRFDSQSPGAFKSTMNPENPVLIEGNWQEPTSIEQEKHDVVSQLQNHLAEVKTAQKKKLRVYNVSTTRRLYTQSSMKRVLVFPNGDSLTKAAYVWGESLHQLLDNATTRLNLRKHGKFLFTLDGQLVTNFDEISRDTVLCVAMTKTFLKPKDSQQNVEIKANWGRARKQYGPRATDIVVATHKNPTVDVDPFGPPALASNGLPNRGIGSTPS